jgi:hypothetical protein
MEEKKETAKKKDEGIVEMLHVAVSVVKDEQLFTVTLPYGFKFPAAMEAVKEISELIEKRSKEYAEHVKKQQEAAAKKAEEGKKEEKVSE